MFNLHSPANNLIQGPLAGVSCAPFRELTWEFSQPPYIYTEMMSCKTILHQSEHAKKRFAYISPKEGPVCFQLSGTDVLELGDTVKRVTDYGASLIDLNCGCPVNKIRSRGAGSALLTNPTLLFQLITTMKNSTHLPISIKIRVQSKSGDQFNQEIAKVINESGADILVVHGRHWTEHYETPCNYDEIKYFVENVKVPVIGNGDVACVESLKRMLATGCKGAMIARAGVGQPWLIAKLQAELKGEVYNAPANTEIAKLYLQHVSGLIELLQSEKFAILQARKFAKYYARQLQNRSEFVAAVNLINNFDDLAKVVTQYFCSMIY